MNATNTEFETVTELPGNKAHKEQLDAMRTRYGWAAEMCCDKDVVEIACGAGIGLGILARNAKTVIGGDVDLKVLKYGVEHYKERNIRLMGLDACKMRLDDNSVDVAICFEATYYFPSLTDFMLEVKRVLRQGGIFLLSSVNCQWHGFNPSPYSNKYHSAAEMLKELEDTGFKGEFFACFEDNPGTLKRRVIGMIRRIAVALHLVPKTMEGKEFFKKLFYGKLDPLPAEITNEHGTMHQLKPYGADVKLENHKFFYFVAKRK
jgi:SAM-dependent methyltransferase